MSTLFRTIEFLCLSLWLGSDTFLSFVVAPGAFRLLASRDEAGAVVGFSLTRMHVAGIACGLVLLAARVLRNRTSVSLTEPTALCVVLMMVLTAISQLVISPRMAALRVRMGSIQATSADSPLLAEFGSMHRVSASLEGCILLLGFAAMYLMVKEMIGVGR
jgi:uncharacterized membrane protein